jgi:hypothetical protein
VGQRSLVTPDRLYMSDMRRSMTRWKVRIGGRRPVLRRLQRAVAESRVVPVLHNHILVVPSASRNSTKACASVPR